MAEKTIPFAGAVDLEAVIIVSSASGAFIDVTDNAIEVKIYEDIFEPFITAKIVLKDTVDLIEKVPIRGEELLHLRARTPTFERPRELIDHTFFIRKIDHWQKDAERSVLYTLHLISVEALTDMNRRYSRTFEGLISDIAEEIFTDELKGFGITIPTTQDETHYFLKYGVEPTINTIKYISNNWSPLRNLQYLASQALNPNLAPNYTVFTNNNGMHFVSIDSLIDPSIQPLYNFVDSNFSRAFDNRGGSSRNVILDYSMVQELRHPVLFDSIKELKSGTFRGKEISYDVLTKRYEEIEYNYDDGFEATNKLNPEPLVIRDIRPDGGMFQPELLFRYNPEHYGAFHKFGKSQPLTLKRNSLLNQMRMHEIEIDVFGRTDYTVGQKVTLVTFKSQIEQTESQEEKIDYYHSGNYLITALVHVISRDGHSCTLNLAKDSYITEGNIGQ